MNWMSSWNLWFSDLTQSASHVIWGQNGGRSRWGWGKQSGKERACVEGQCRVFVFQLKLKKYFFKPISFCWGKRCLALSSPCFMVSVSDLPFSLWSWWPSSLSLSSSISQTAPREERAACVFSSLSYGKSSFPFLLPLETQKREGSQKLVSRLQLMSFRSLPVPGERSNFPLSFSKAESFLSH